MYRIPGLSQPSTVISRFYRISDFGISCSPSNGRVTEGIIPDRGENMRVEYDNTHGNAFGICKRRIV